MVQRCRKLRQEAEDQKPVSDEEAQAKAVALEM